ncbi:MAG: four helix bundle protein [Candidatus Omnitrophica bacterium]|nr:four helix bundle protein [Candidatus Omnitrophota bacterium]
MGFKFEELKIWQEAVKFANDIYTLVKKFPRGEQFGLTSQLTRAAVSISLNIAEGQGRNSHADFSRFIQMSIGSVNEVATILHIALEQKYISKEEFNISYNKCIELSKMLYSFRKYLKQL